MVNSHVAHMGSLPFHQRERSLSIHFHQPPISMQTETEHLWHRVPAFSRNAHRAQDSRRNNCHHQRRKTHGGVMAICQDNLWFPRG